MLRASLLALAVAGACVLESPERSAALTFVSDASVPSPRARLQYFGRWERVANRRDGRFDGTSRRTVQPGSGFTFTFRGGAVRVYGVCGTGGGAASTEIDGHPSAGVNFYATNFATRRLVYSSPLLAPGLHVLTLTATGFRLRSHRRGYVNVSGVAYE